MRSPVIFAAALLAIPAMTYTGLASPGLPGSGPSTFRIGVQTVKVIVRDVRYRARVVGDELVVRSPGDVHVFSMSRTSPGGMVHRWWSGDSVGANGPNSSYYCPAFEVRTVVAGPNG